MPQIPDCTCDDTECLDTPSQCGTMCLGDGDLESLRPCGEAEWYSRANLGAVNFVVAPSLTGGGWLRCGAADEHSSDLPISRR